MAVNKFLWDVNIDDLSGDIVFNNKTVTMGDGYEQDVSFGINPVKRNWSWSLIDFKNQVMIIEDFLIATKGSEVFEWDSPRGLITVKVTDIKCIPMGGNLWKLSATFLQRSR